MLALRIRTGIKQLLSRTAKFRGAIRQGAIQSQLKYFSSKKSKECALHMWIRPKCIIQRTFELLYKKYSEIKTIIKQNSLELAEIMQVV